jgi:MFS family permease
MPSNKPESIWTRAFVLLCLAEFLGYAQHFVLQPAFPLYITHLGGSPFIVGLVIASFGVTSVVSRPIIGYWADRWSVTGVMILGLLTQAISISFCFMPFVGATMFANGLRGIGWSGMNTGGYTLLATAAPADRRGEASGYYGGVQSAATILFPAVALWIIDAHFGGFRATFLIAMSLVLGGAVTAYVLSRSVPRHPRNAEPARLNLGGAKLSTSLTATFSWLRRSFSHCIFHCLACRVSSCFMRANSTSVTSVGTTWRSA